MDKSQLDLYSWMSHAASVGYKAALAGLTEKQLLSSIKHADAQFQTFAAGKYAEYLAKLAAIKAINFSNGANTTQVVTRNNCKYQRVGVLPASAVIDNIGQTIDTYFGVKVELDGWRLRMYAAKGVKCVKCGLEGTMFAVERHFNPNCSGTKYHLNLYHVHSSGQETMITVDHIIPKSRGGGNELANLQPMCFPCNTRKGNNLERPCTDGVVAA
jgi:hypothetical protein